MRIICTYDFTTFKVKVFAGCDCRKLRIAVVACPGKPRQSSTNLGNCKSAKDPLRPKTVPRSFVPSGIDSRDHLYLESICYIKADRKFEALYRTNKTKQEIIELIYI